MKYLYYLVAPLLCGSGLLAGCNSGPNSKSGPARENTAREAAAAVSPDSIVIGALPPHDLPAGSDPVLLAEFAWAEFFALNWQSSYDKDHKRDNPDTSWDYSQADTTSLSVWETYAHRTELRPASQQMLPFDQGPHYSFGVKPGGVPLTPFDNLDEDSEIGSCVVYHLPAPTTATDTIGREHMVLYQAKVNRAEYDYIQANYNTPQKLALARAATLSNINTYGSYKKPQQGTPNSTCDCPPGVICLPCGNKAVPGSDGQGTIEIKSAWRRLAPGEDPSHFITRKVLYYTQTINPHRVHTVKRYDCDGVAMQKDSTRIAMDTVQTAHYGRYALIGLHIIHKTRNYPSFVFATFEHVSVQDARHPMAYQLLDGGGYLQAGSLDVNYKRLHPVTAVNDAVTAAAQAAIKKKRPGSVLQYYRLGGVQGAPTNDAGSPDFYLANYVVESDSTLANFRGSGIGSPHNVGSNVLVPGTASVSMGGCKGCHGVAQTKIGTDFSFLLDGVGKPVQYPDPASAMLPPKTTTTGPGGLKRPGTPLPRILAAQNTANLSADELRRALQANRSGTSPAPLGKLGRYIQATAR